MEGLLLVVDHKGGLLAMWIAEKNAQISRDCGVDRTMESVLLGLATRHLNRNTLHQVPLSPLNG